MRLERDILKTAAVILLLFGVYAGAVFWPSQRQNQAMATQIADKQASLDKLQVPDLAPLRKEIAALRAELSQGAPPLPVGDSSYRVLERISEAITSNGITVYDTAHRPSKHYARFAVTPVDVQFSTGFERAFAILRTIEAADPPVRIERLELTGSPDETTGHVAVSVQLSSFFLPKQPGGALP